MNPPSPIYCKALCIDPGASGGASFSDLVSGQPCDLHSWKSPRAATLFLERCLNGHTVFPAVIENVHATPIMSVSSAFSFGQNFGAWLGILASWDIPVWLVTPQEWQKGLAIPAEIQGTDRKAALKAMATTLFTPQKITLANCDAALLGHVTALYRAKGTLPGKRDE